MGLFFQGHSMRLCCFMTLATSQRMRCFSHQNTLDHLCSKMVASSLSGSSSTCSSRKRLRNARDNALRPAYAPGGFCVRQGRMHQDTWAVEWR
jgi:hypothetical protein